MKRSFLLAPILCCLLGTVSLAQPDPNEAPKGVNPPVAMPGITPADWQKMTPQQKRAALQKGVEDTLRGTMTWLGYTDKPLQDAIIASALEREKALDEVRDKHRLVAQALIARQNDAQMEIALDNLRMAEDAAAEARAKQIAELDEKIDFSNKPRLTAFLSLVGILNDDSATLGGVLGSTISTMTNLAMGDVPKPAAAPVAPAPQ